MSESIIKFFKRTNEVKEALKRANFTFGSQEVVYSMNKQDRDLLKANLLDDFVIVV